MIGPACGEERLLAAGGVLERAMLELPDRGRWPYRGWPTGAGPRLA